MAARGRVPVLLAEEAGLVARPRRPLVQVHRIVVLLEAVFVVAVVVAMVRVHVRVFLVRDGPRDAPV